MLSSAPSFAGTERRLAGAVFDVIFLDPPYGAEALASALAAAEPLVGEGTRLVLEHARRDAPPGRSGALERTRLVTSGDSALAFYRRAAAAGEPLAQRQGSS